MTERSFIAKTQKEGGQWSKGDINFGFNISRVFVIGKKDSKSQFTFTFISLLNLSFTTFGIGIL